MCITVPTFEAEKYITAFRIYITAAVSTSQLARIYITAENLPHRLSKISPMVKRASRHKKNAIFVINLRLPLTNDRLANLWVR